MSPRKRAAANGSYPAFPIVLMPMASASSSCWREKLASVRCVEASASLPEWSSRTSVATRLTMSALRALFSRWMAWLAVMWPISWPRTAAIYEESLASASNPRVT